jgi:hypothetical protein
MTVSPRDRHIIFFGTQTTPGTASTYDPMAVLFGSQESTTDFIPTATNTAGFQRLSSGNRIVTAVPTRGDILILTNISAHSMQFVGPPYTFSFKQIGTNCGALGVIQQRKQKTLFIGCQMEHSICLTGLLNKYLVQFKIMYFKI